MVYRLVNSQLQKGNQLTSSAIRPPVQGRLVPLRCPPKSWRWGGCTGERRSPLSTWPLREAGPCSGQVQGSGRQPWGVTAEHQAELSCHEVSWGPSCFFPALGVWEAPGLAVDTVGRARDWS